MSKNSKIKNILIIEDDVLLRNLLVELLSKNKYKVFEAKDGVIGFKILKNTKPDLVIMDLCIEPRGMDEGYNTLKRKSKYKEIKNIPVIIISGYHLLYKLQKYKVDFSDVKAVLEKPVTLEQILKIIRKLNGFLT